MEWLKNWLIATQFDFVGKFRVTAIGSAVLVLLSWLAFVGVTPNWGIDFTGGTEIHLQFDDGIDIGELRATLAELDIPSDAIQEVGGLLVNEFKVRIKDAEFGATEVQEAVEAKLVDAFGADWIREIAFSAEVGARFNIVHSGESTTVADVTAALSGLEGLKVEEGREEAEIVIKLPGLASVIEREISTAMGDRAFTVLSVDAVGPKVGESLRTQGFAAIAATLGLVLLYIAFRFDIAFAPGAILALVHDLSVTVGVFVLLGREFNLPTIGALLTIVGYSLNDTIVIFDRIRENASRYRREDTLNLINVSVNETFTRTIATSVSTMLAISPFLFIGTEVIRDFALAMVLGIILGTYSTIFIATPVIPLMERIKPKLLSIIALPDLDEPDEVPDQFLSESERRRRERERLEKEAAEGAASPPGVG